MLKTVTNLEELCSSKNIRKNGREKLMMRRKHHYQMYSQFSFIRTLTSLSEYTIEFLLSRPEEFCSGITVYHTGVADEILGFVEKEQGEVVGSQMAEQINIEKEFSSLLFLLPLPSPSKCMGLSAAGLKLLAWGLAT